MGDAANKSEKKPDNEFELSGQNVYGNQSNINFNRNGNGCSSIFIGLINKTKIILSVLVLFLALLVIMLIVISPPTVIAIIATIVAIFLVVVVIKIFWWLVDETEQDNSLSTKSNTPLENETSSTDAS